MAKKGGLGRGLSSLISSASQESRIGEEIHELALDAITPNPDQPRVDFNEEDLAELTDSISQVGVLQPLLVRPVGDGYQIIAGERRWHAARAAGLERVPVQVQIADDAGTLALALIENLQRADLNPIEEAHGFKRLLEATKMTQSELASKVSRSRSAVTNALRLLDLPEEVQEMMFNNKLSAGHARAVLSLPGEAGRVKLAEKIVAEGLSVRDAENLARLFAAGEQPRGVRAVTPRSFKVVARKLRQMLGTNVRVKQIKDRNKIEIEFRDEDDLQRIFATLSNSAPTEE